MYQEVILYHAKNPIGKMPSLSGGSCLGGCGISDQYNPTCGDEISLLAQLSDKNGQDSDKNEQNKAPESDDSRSAQKNPSDFAEQKIEEIKWAGQGCSISQASASIMTDMLSGKTLSDYSELDSAFRELMNSRGAGIDENKEDLLEDLTAFTGTSRFPARIKCALLGWEAIKDALIKAGAFG
jgi:nitrogen fixation NifU-like protein